MKKSIKGNNQKGFTLIELLAVVTIIGILTMVAIPSVNAVVEWQRKRILTTTIKTFGRSAISMVSGFEFGDISGKDTLYYIPVSDDPSKSCIPLETGGKDPFGDWKDAYVVVHYNPDKLSYNYYFTFNDSSNHGLPLTSIDGMSESGRDILNELPDAILHENITTQTAGGLTNIAIMQVGPGGDCDVNNVTYNAPSSRGPRNGAELIISKGKPTSAEANAAGQVHKISQAATIQKGPNEEYRFIGNNSNNYFRFNNEMWRVLGVFDMKIKLVKDTKVGWHDVNHTYEAHNDSCMPFNDLTQTNRWEESTVAKYLNGTYFNRINDFDRGFIYPTTYYFGGFNGGHMDNPGTARYFYEVERGNNINTRNSFSWTGMIGLFYPSDFAYATGGDGSVNAHENCVNSPIANWNGNACVTNNWMKKNDYSNSWTMVPQSDSSRNVLLVDPNGIIGNEWRGGDVAGCYSAYPVLYLHPDTMIGGDGSRGDPYYITGYGD